MRGGRSSIEEPGLREHKGARAHRHRKIAVFGRQPYPIQNRRTLAPLSGYDDHFRRWRIIHGKIRDDLHSAAGLNRRCGFGNRVQMKGRAMGAKALRRDENLIL